MSIGASENTISTVRESFFRRIFGEVKGFICIGAKNRKGRFGERFFEFPNEMAGTLEYIAELEPAHDVYYCAQLLQSRRRRRENVTDCSAAWADLDECHPDSMRVQPSISIQTSPDRYQALWVFEKPQHPFDAEQISKRIAYAHVDEGVDTSGWDLTQLLRVPGTTNHKYPNIIPLPKVTIYNRTGNLYRPEDFNAYPQIQGETYKFVDLEDVELPDETADELLERWRGHLSDVIFEWYTSHPRGDWSTRLWQLEKELLTAGLSQAETFIICSKARCNKYRRDNRNPEHLWKEINKAWAEVQESQDHYGLRFNRAGKMIHDDEIEAVEADHTLVEEYIQWASERTDAAPQYHQAGAFTLLSVLGSTNIRLATSFGLLVPNLWFMILGDTTLTRKSTAMDMALGILDDVAPETLLATDSSVEGLISALALRDGRASLFHRDEITGMFAQMNKREHLAGMAETFTRLYDGGRAKRVLRSQTISVDKPVFIFLGGGIRNKLYSQLTEEHIESGLLPRFIFILADTDADRLQALGRETSDTTNKRKRLVEAVQEFAYKYSKTTETRFGRTISSEPAIIKADLTDDAWARYQDLEKQMVNDGMKSGAPDLCIPMYQRLTTSILKAAVLIAASRPANPTGGRITVSRADLLKAMYYGRQWRSWANEVIHNTGQSLYENKLQKILQSIYAEPDGIPRGAIMRRHHLMAREADMFLTTITERELVRTATKGNTRFYYPPVGR